MPGEPGLGRETAALDGDAEPGRGEGALAERVPTGARVRGAAGECWYCGT